MVKVRFSDDFKRDAVHQITERGYPVVEVSQRLGVSPHSLYAWKKKFSKPSNDRCRAAGSAHDGVAQEAKEQAPHPLRSYKPWH